MYITHDVQSSFVTHKKEKKDESLIEDEEFEYILFIVMRYQLGVDISDFLLIKLYWWHLYDVEMKIMSKYFQNTWPVTLHSELQKTKGAYLFLIALMVTINCSLLCLIPFPQRKPMLIIGQ